MATPMADQDITPPQPRGGSGGARKPSRSRKQSPKLKVLSLYKAAQQQLKLGHTDSGIALLEQLRCDVHVGLV